MAPNATRLLTAEEFYEWTHLPENDNCHCELERGQVVQLARPGKRHGLVCANAAGILGNYVAERKRGYVCSNHTGVVVERDPDTVRGPDVMLFEDAQRAEDVDEKYGDHPPLLAIEVLSPNDTTGKLMRRIREQFRFGTRAVWVLDPEARNVIVYRPGMEDRIAEEKEELTGDDILPDFRCRVAEFFVLPGQ
ncbi:MAG TPA: Uma2 family endonuclease [Gemmataceae bacterium]|nr:Uma2 family endonuclease [Gemmataceae bacterium]